jgi:hypothetical protein
MKPNVLLLALAILASSFSTPAQRVLFIGIDGCRSDGYEAAATPNLDALRDVGFYSPDGLNDDITVSGPGWSGLLTGVRSNLHNVTDNGFGNHNLAQFPSFFQRIEDLTPDRNTVSIVHWSPINDYIVGSSADEALNVSTDQAVADEAVARLIVSGSAGADPHAVFLHFDEVDYAGHSNMFDPTVPAYLAAIEGVDAQIGQVLAALYARPAFEQEQWLIAISSDHGGVGYSHGGTSIEHRRIPFIVSGAGVGASVVLAEEIWNDTPENCLAQSAPEGPLLPWEELRFGEAGSGSGNRVAVQAHSDFDFGVDRDFTVEFRIKTTEAADVAILGNKDWDSGGNPGFVFSFKYASGPEWKVNAGDGTNRVDINANTITDGQWHHLAASFDRDGLLSVYADGVLQGSADMSAVGDMGATNQLFFGSDALSAYSYNGAIAEVRVWDVILPQAEIDAWQCEALDSAHPHYTDLLGYWRLIDGEPSAIAADDSGAGHNGTIEGASWVDPSPQLSYDYSATPRQVDIVPTLFAHLCIELDPFWVLQGAPLIDLPPCLVVPENACSGDLNGDQLVGVGDILLLLGQFGNTCN